MIYSTCQAPPLVLLSHKDPVIRLGLSVALENSRFSDQVRCAVPADDDYEGSVGSAAVVVTDYDQALQVCARARQRKWRANSPAPRVMVVSHREGEHEIRAAVSAGVMGYLSSGSQLAEFIKGIEALFRNSRYLSNSAVQKIADSMTHDDLTPRELEVLHCLVNGKVNKQICDELDIALGTVKSHVKSIFSKFGVVTRTQAVRVALQRGLLTIADSPWMKTAGDLSHASQDRPHIQGIALDQRRSPATQSRALEMLRSQ